MFSKKKKSNTNVKLKKKKTETSDMMYSRLNKAINWYEIGKLIHNAISICEAVLRQRLAATLMLVLMKLLELEVKHVCQ